MLNVRRLWVLREVARHGSFTAAAEALVYTPSAVSQQIAAFEREVGVPLVERGARGVTLTEPGRLLVAGADVVFGQLTLMEGELRALAGMDSGLLRLGWFATAGSTLVARAIAAFRSAHPGVALDLFQGDPDECVPKLRAGELELALVYRFAAEPELPAGIERINLIDDPLDIGLPRDHRLAGRRTVELTDLAGEHWIQGVRRGATLDVLPAACRDAGFEPVVALRTDDRTAVEGLVAAGVGVALIPRLTAPTVRPDVVVRPLNSTALRREVSVALGSNRYRPPATAAMLDALTTTCADLATEAADRIKS
jgi:DNA-binding transcriptional LysR family regulator